MARGRSITTYLCDGTITGIRRAEVGGWNGQAILCPRNRVGDLKKWMKEWMRDVAGPGVYFLIGAESREAREVYIGESESVHTRICQQLARKDFWQVVVLFTVKDDSLTKAHVKYLESRLCGLCSAASRYRLNNPNQEPTKSHLPRADSDAMEEFIDNIRLLLGALGHRLLEPLVAAPDQGDPPSGTVVFHCRIKEASARAVQTDEGFVILRGSTALSRMAPQMNPGAREVKQDLIKRGVLVAKGAVLEFRQDSQCLSPNQAASIIFGNAVNARKAWKTTTGRTLKEIEDGASGAES
jgi:hypothetical protein